MGVHLIRGLLCHVNVIYGTGGTHEMILAVGVHSKRHIDRFKSFGF